MNVLLVGGRLEDYCAGDLSMRRIEDWPLRLTIESNMVLEMCLLRQVNLLF